MLLPRWLEESRERYQTDPLIGNVQLQVQSQIETYISFYGNILGFWSRILREINMATTGKKPPDPAVIAVHA